MRGSPLSPVATLPPFPSHPFSLLWANQFSSQWLLLSPPPPPGDTPGTEEFRVAGTPQRHPPAPPLGEHRARPGPHPLLIFSGFSQPPPQHPTWFLPGPLRGQGPRPGHPLLPSFQDAVASGAMTQRHLKPTGPVGRPPRCAGSWPTTATKGVAVSVAGAPRPPSCSNSSSSSPSPHLPDPCGSGSALLWEHRGGHLQPPLPPGNWPAPSSRPPHPPPHPQQHPPWPEATQPCPPQSASSWSPAGPRKPGPCPPLQPAAPSPPTTPVLTQPSLPRALFLPPRFLPGPGACPPHPSPWSLTLGLRAATSASPVTIQGFQARPVRGASVPGWPTSLPLLTPSLCLLSSWPPPPGQGADEHRLAGQLWRGGDRSREQVQREGGAGGWREHMRAPSFIL